MKTNKKLTFYSIFKTENKKAEFLDYIKNPIHKKIINKFRLGNYKLRIETGRHTWYPKHLNIYDLAKYAIHLRLKMKHIFFLNVMHIMTFVISTLKK